MLHVIVLLFALVLGVGSVVFMKKDSPVEHIIEDFAEEIVLHQTGVEVDFDRLRSSPPDEQSDRVSP